MKELFGINEIDNSIAAAGSKLSASKNVLSADQTLQVRSRASQLISELMGKIISENIIEFCTAGEFSMHHLIEYLLEQTGPADIYLSTWTIKEEPARVLFNLKKSGLIKNLYCVFDYRIRTLDAKHFDFVKNIVTAYTLTKCHAKTVAIEGEKFSLALSSSANLSNNPRIETGYISCNMSSMLFHKGWIMDSINGKKVY